MKKIILSFLGLMLSMIVFAEHVPQNVAQQVAQNFLYENTGEVKANFTLFEVVSDKKSDMKLYYIFNFNNGFIIVSADDNLIPILGYSFENKYTGKDIPPQMVAWMQNYADQISYAIDNNLKAEKSTKNKWTKYKGDIKSIIVNKSAKAVTPLLGTIEWGQGTGWNDDCPVDATGTNGHALVGCVATAIGQVMKYWEYPTNGVGSHSYTHATYGLQSANYGSTTYDWALMSDDVGNAYSAELLYHVGVAVEMDYGPDGSSATTSKGGYILSRYFKYKTGSTYIRKYNYSDTDWENIIKNELDNDRPILYRGDDDDGHGHAFVLDGYDNSGGFHFNWGWTGSYNAYFYLNDLTPGTRDYTFGQSATIRVQPDFTEPTSLTAEINVYDVDVAWEKPLYWQRYTDLTTVSNINWGGPERAVYYDNDDFDFTYPATINAVSHAFYNYSSNPWLDSTFHFKIYAKNGSTLLYESGDIEARHKEEIFHELTTPIEVTDDFYVAVFSVAGDALPSSYSLKVPLGTTHSYSGSSGSWTIYENSTDGYDFIAGVSIAGQGIVKSNNSKAVSGYIVSRDGVPVSSTLSSSTFNYTDNSVPIGSHDYCVTAVYADGSSDCSNSVNVQVVTVKLDESDKQVKFYPNPVTNFIFIDIPNSKSELTVYDLAGRIVLSQELVSPSNKISLSNLEKGIYVFELKSDEYEIVEKIQIK